MIDIIVNSNIQQNENINSNSLNTDFLHKVISVQVGYIKLNDDALKTNLKNLEIDPSLELSKEAKASLLDDHVEKLSEFLAMRFPQLINEEPSIYQSPEQPKKMAPLFNDMPHALYKVESRSKVDVSWEIESYEERYGDRASVAMQPRMVFSDADMTGYKDDTPILDSGVEPVDHDGYD